MVLLRRIFIAALLLMPTLAFAQIKELCLYNQWYSDISEFKPDRPFFVIRDYDSFTELWQKSHMKGDLPLLSFEKYMVLVWAPGKTLCDCRNVRLQRFVYKNSAFVAVYNFVDKLHDSVWHSPVVASVLPASSGDIFIQSVKIDKHKTRYSPVFTIWNMSGTRTKPFNVVKLEGSDKTSGGVVSAVSNVSNVGGTNAQTAKPKKAAVRFDTPIEKTLSEPVKPKQEEPRAVLPSAGNAAEKNNDFSDPFAFKQETKPARKANSPIKTPALPAFEEDPLFGSEFDIEF